MIPIILFLVTLTILQAYPGDTVNVSISDPAVLSVGDKCMYFESLNVTLNASVGVHQVKIGVNCSSNIKNVTANG